MISSFRQKVQANTDRGKADPAEMPAQTFDVRSAQARKRRLAAQAPITAHRLFPAICALWFAALLGFGSLAISSEVLGALVTKIGLPALVPAAAPPLGFTARLLLALVLAAVGTGLGLGLGLRLQGQSTAATRPAESAFAPASATVPESAPVSASSAQGADTALPKVRARDAHPDAPPRRPLVLTEAFAEPGSSLAAPLIDEVMVPASPLLRSKPEPGQSADLRAERAPLRPVYEPVGGHVLTPLDFEALDLEGFDLADARQVPANGPFAPPEPLPEPVQVAEVAPEPAPEPAVAPAARPAPPQLLAATPQVPSGVTLARPSPEQILAGEPWSPVGAAPLADLGLVQLIERLALAIAARKAAREAGSPPSDGTPADVPAEGLIEAAAEAPAEDAPGPFAKPANAPPASSDIPLGSVREAIMRRLEAAALPSAQPSAPLSALPSAPGVGPAPFSRPQRADAVVSLHREGHVPTDEAAAVMTPAPAATEEALRSALATLQRISARG